MRVSDIKKSDNVYFNGNWIPVEKEHNEVCTKVIGTIPKELAGAFLRIGSNPVFVDDPDKYYVFEGDGMIHEVAFANGQATYINRFVETDGHMAEREKGDFIWNGMETTPENIAQYGPSKNIANTAMVFHGGKFQALQEGSRPFHLTLPNLDPVGEMDYDGKLDHALTAHPKVDPRTGEMVTYGYNVLTEPYCIVSVINKEGEMTHTTPVTIPTPIMMHDCAISENYTIIMDLPCIFNLDRLAQGKSVLYFEPENGTRFGLLKRGADGEDIRWFDVETCYCYHTVNAFEEGDEVVVEGCRSDRNNIGDEDLAGKPGDRSNLPMMYQWRFNLKTGEVIERKLDNEWGSEFARINENYIGIRNQYTYAARIAGDTLDSSFDGIIKYDLRNDTSVHYAYGEGRVGGEPIFAPKPNGVDEEDGWVVGFVRDHIKETSECIIIDAKRFEDGPIARVVIPARVPFGFHSAWVDQKVWEGQLTK
jgi:carotenoid cleavage dioxygenase-like enzyme